MRIVLMADSPLGVEVARYLVEHEEDVVGCVIHPPKWQKNTEEILEILNFPEDRIIRAEDLKTPEGIARLKALQPDIIFVVYWSLILKEEVIAIPLKGCVNFHYAYLPYNRGKNPNVWPIIEGTPAGVTLHYIDPGIDTGDIIAQTEVKVEPVDTAESLYEKLHYAFIALFKETYPLLKAGTAKRIKQEDANATFHLAKDFKALGEIDLQKEYKAEDLINLLRAKTFPPHPSAWFIKEGKKVYIEVALRYEDQ